MLTIDHSFIHQPPLYNNAFFDLQHTQKQSPKEQEKNGYSLYKNNHFLKYIWTIISTFET